MTVAIHIGDCRDILRTLPDESVHCVVTSPPYWNLRDYGTAKWEGGDATCDHLAPLGGGFAAAGLGNRPEIAADKVIRRQQQYAHECRKCGAHRIDSQIGLEPDFCAYVSTMVEVFREVKRVLRPDGVCFLNLGDSFCSRDTILEYELRKDLSLTELQHVALAMFGVRITEDEASGKGALPEVLSDIVQGQAICDQPTLASGRVEEKLSEASSGSNCENGSAEQTDKDRRDNGSGRQMRLLWGDDPAIPDLGSHQRGWRGPSEKDGAVNHSDLSASAPRRLSETQISHSVFQLQLRDRIMGFLSARKFAEAKIPTSVRTCFKASSGLKPKDLVGIPWRVAFALQEDGWYLRQDIIWSKPNPMPESVTDRCTKAHEYLFLLAKSERYYYDQDAIREEPTGRTDPIVSFGKGKPPCSQDHTPNYQLDGMVGRNKRSVWEIATAPFSEAHFATFPLALIEPCIKAGTSAKGCCGKCGAPWRRAMEMQADTRKSYITLGTGPKATVSRNDGNGLNKVLREDGRGGDLATQKRITTGWLPSCRCAAAAAPCTVLDPFAGAGTTGLVADRLQRSAILIELNPEYAAMARKRITGDAPLFVEVAE